MGPVTRSLFKLRNNGLSSSPVENKKLLREWCEVLGINIVSLEKFREWTEKGKRTAIGAGAYGACYKLDIAKDRSIVVKEYSRGDATAFVDLINESRRLLHCQSDHNQRFVGICVDNETMISEYEGEVLRA